MKNKLAILLVIVFSINSCAQNYTNKIKDKGMFDKMSGLPLVDKYGKVSALKVVFDLKTEKLYFINSSYFKYHYEFCNTILHYNVGLDYFNKANYSDYSKRRFLLANINHFESTGDYAMEISAVDVMPCHYILKLYSLIGENTFLGDSLKFLVNTTRLQKEQECFRPINIIAPEDVYGKINYQAISKNSAYGVLKFIENIDSAINNISPTDIIVLNNTPLYLPKVAGVIVNQLQTPLSHLTILGQNRKIPIIAYTKAFSDNEFMKLDNQKVFFEVKNNDFSINRVDDIKTTSNKTKNIKLKYNLEVDSLLSIENLCKKSYTYCGNKAANFALLNKLSKKGDFKTPESAFVVPFYFYNQHIRESGVNLLIDSLLNNKNGFKEHYNLKVFLGKIRDTIKNHPINIGLLKSIEQKIIEEGSYTRMRFRSSTNAEDAKGFSGAGLYASKTGILNHDKKTIEKAVKKVWASLWSFEAFSEREFFNINHHDVFMGILVHRSFPNEAVNGVAITKNIYRNNSYGFVINAQLGNENVVKPDSNIICDQFICYPNNADNIYENKNTVDIITVSNLNNHQLVMTDVEIQNLANQLQLIKRYWHKRSFSAKTYIDYGLDIEFKLDGENRDLYIKQVRPYND